MLATDEVHNSSQSQNAIEKDRIKSNLFKRAIILPHGDGCTKAAATGEDLVLFSVWDQRCKVSVGHVDESGWVS